jgi:hypothetical protein
MAFAWILATLPSANPTDRDSIGVNGAFGNSKNDGL